MNQDLKSQLMNIFLQIRLPKGRSTSWEPDQGEQETSDGNHPAGESQRTKLMKDYVRDLYESYQKTLVKPQNYFTMIILNSKVENYAT